MIQKAASTSGLGLESVSTLFFALLLNSWVVVWGDSASCLPHWLSASKKGPKRSCESKFRETTPKGGRGNREEKASQAYEKGNIFNKDPLRVRKLLLHKYEIRKLAGKMAEQGYTIVPLQVYFKEGRAKIEVGLAKGKKLYDKRQDIAKKDLRRELEREFKIKNLG